MPGKIKLIIFDLDGTLMDAYLPVTQSLNFALRKSGFPPMNRAVIKKSVGWGDTTLIRKIVGEEKTPAVLKIYRRHHLTALPKGVKALPGCREILRYLKKEGYRLAIASNRPTRYSRIAVRALKIDKFFSYTLCADRVKRGKPYPDMFWCILKKFSVKPSEALYVGDMAIDIVAGRRAGIRTVSVISGSCSKRELQKEKPFRIIPRLLTLKKLLRSL